MYNFMPLKIRKLKLCCTLILRLSNLDKISLLQTFKTLKALQYPDVSSL